MIIRLFFIFILVLGINQQTISQNAWVKPGAEWHYDNLGVFGPWLTHFFYEKDTMIQNKTCQVVKGVNYHPWWDSTNIYRGLFQYSTFKNYLHTSVDTVFWYVNGDFYILYNFAAKIGDSWDLGLDSFPSGNCSRPIVTVTSTSKHKVDNKTFNYYGTSLTPMSQYEFGQMIERIGSLTYLFPTYDYFCDTTSGGIPEPTFRWLHCYKDDIIGEVDSTSLGWGHACDITRYIGIKEQSLSELMIYPNPTSGEFTIHLVSAIEREIQIFNSLGGIVHKQTIQNKRQAIINLPSSLVDGIYIVKLIGNDSIFTQKLLLKRE